MAQLLYADAVVSHAIFASEPLLVAQQAGGGIAQPTPRGVLTASRRLADKFLHADDISDDIRENAYFVESTLAARQGRYMNRTLFPNSRINLISAQWACFL